ncbi:MAG TPA: hypothetical protein VLF40_06755 [Candidatus Saccharimonadales bacterium]|nr:hypothetical protein [Candidatus Saccharimonadales bacterium]
MRLFPRSRLTRESEALAAAIQDAAMPATPVAMTPDGRIVWDEYALPAGTLLVAPDAPREAVRHLARAALSGAKAPLRPNKLDVDSRSSYARIRFTGELAVKHFPRGSEEIDSGAAALCANVALTAGLTEQNAGYGDWQVRGAQYYGMFQPSDSTASTWVMEQVHGEASGWHVAHGNPRREYTPSWPQRNAMFVAALEEFGIGSETVLVDGNTRNLLVTREPDTFVKFDARIREGMLEEAWVPVPVSELMMLRGDDTIELNLAA